MPLVTRQVIEHYARADQSPCEGYVQLAPVAALTAAAEALVWPTPVEAVLDASGNLAVNVLATGQAGVGPAGWCYRITEIIDGITRDPWLAFIPAGAGQLTLRSISPLTDQPDLLEFVLLSNVGAVGGPGGPLDAQGKLPLAQMPDGVGGGTPSDTVAAETSYGIAAAAGTGTDYARGDHTHGTPAAPTPASIGAATSGHAHTGVYDPAGTAATQVTAHEGDTDPHGDRSYTDTQVSGRVPTSRQVIAGTGLTGGGTLAADRTLAVAYGTTAGTAAQGDDSRLADARSPLAHAASHATAGSDPIAPAAIGAETPAGAQAKVDARTRHKDTGLLTGGAFEIVVNVWTTVGPDLTIAAAAGDVLVLEPDILLEDGAVCQFDAQTRLGADGITLGRWWSTGTSTERWPGCLANFYVYTGWRPIPGPVRYTVQAADIELGQVRVRLVGRRTGTSGAGRILRADTTYPARWCLKNLGPATT